MWTLFISTEKTVKVRKMIIAERVFFIIGTHIEKITKTKSIHTDI